MGYISQNYLPITTTSSLVTSELSKEDHQPIILYKETNSKTICLFAISQPQYNSLVGIVLFVCLQFPFFMLCFCVSAHTKNHHGQNSGYHTFFFCNEIFNKSFLFLLSFNQIYWHLYSFSTTTFNNI